MKKVSYTLVLTTLFMGMFALSGCSKSDSMDDGVRDGLWLKMGDNSIVSTSGIDVYDVSTHMIYLKKKLPYLAKVGYDGGLLSVHVGKDYIYKCPFRPAFSSLMPSGVNISSPPFNTEDIIRIGFVQFYNQNHEPIATNPHSDERIMEALKKYGQYHEGLHCELISCNYSNGKLVLNIELSNPDTFNYYYLDPDKMGFSLFHYFTNGPTFWDIISYHSFTHKETVTRPNPWNSWKKEWLTLIKSGERKNISITYNHFDTMPAGKYKMYFEFPGLNHGISQKDITLHDGRIWMGSIGIEKELTF